ncbi:putative multidrug export ATP-binding/permease protein [compost metagenome]
MRETQGKEDEDIVWSSLERSGLSEKVKNLPKGIYTELTQEFDKEGVMLSGGEIQKLALARMFASDSGIIILDEPSSALDPIAEHEVHQQMIDASDGKTVILISHRLSTARMVDRIFLFKEGSILEEGSHNELMDLNGEYAHMFKLQAEKYLP